MEETIEVLEKKHDGLNRELQDVGDFRRGIISVIYRKCGKKNCACAQPGHPGHGPVYLWNTAIKGKSYAKSLKLGPELQKYIGEIGNHKKFMKICEQIVVINERISDLRIVTKVKDEEELGELKKIAEAIHQEVKNEIERILGRYLSDNVISIVGALAATTNIKIRIQADYQQLMSLIICSNFIFSYKPIPKMYVCMDGNGVPVVKKETAYREGCAGP